jgi:hypothetical protein
MCQPALDTSAKVARDVIRGWTKSKHKENGSPFMDTSKLQAFLNDLLLKQLENFSTWTKTRPQTMMGLLRGHCYLIRYLYKLGLVKSNECERCQ